jgi:hypothetical protein
MRSYRIQLSEKAHVVAHGRLGSQRDAELSMDVCGSEVLEPFDMGRQGTARLQGLHEAKHRLGAAYLTRS